MPDGRSGRPAARVVRLLGAGAAGLLLLSGCASAPAADVELSLGEYYIAGPATLPSGTVTLGVTNDGGAHHALSICPLTDEDAGCAETSLEMRVLSKPEQARVPEGLPDRTSALLLGSDWEYVAEVDLEPGAYRFFCGLINHPERGMWRDVTVTERDV